MTANAAVNLDIAEQIDIAEEDALRAQLYGLLARLLARPADADVLSLSAAMTGDDTELGKAIGGLAQVAGRTDEAQIAQEYHDLFIGVGRGELVPYASYYLTGFLYDKPLAKLRGDMGALGIKQPEEVSDPEDHIASIMEIMSGLITGSFGAPASLEAQKTFFDTHLRPWAPHFFADLEAAKSSVLYAGVGAVGRIFMDIERSAFEMD